MWVWIVIGTFVLFFVIDISNAQTIRKDKLKAMEDYLLELPDFTATQKFIEESGGSGLAIDETQKKVCLIGNEDQGPSGRIMTYRDILSSEIFENGTSVSKTSRSSQIGGALIGGLALGGAGMVIGGLSGKSKSTEKVSRVDLRITVNDTKKPIHDIAFMNIGGLSCKKGSPVYKEAMNNARHWHGLIDVVIKRADSEDQNNLKPSHDNIHTSIADELIKLAALKENGVLSPEEFQQQKTKLLNQQEVLPKPCELAISDTSSPS